MDGEEGSMSPWSRDPVLFIFKCPENRTPCTKLLVTNEEFGNDLGLINVCGTLNHVTSKS